MTVLRSPGDEPEKNSHARVILSALAGGEVVSLDELLSIGAEAAGLRARRPRKDVGFLEAVERVTRKGWDHTLRTSFLLAVMTILVGAVLWVLAGLLASVCTTIVLLLVNYVVRVTRSVRVA